MTQAGGGGRQPLAVGERGAPLRAGEKKPPVGSTPDDPAFVFVSHAAFANLEPSEANYMGYDIITQVTFPLVSGRWPIGTLPVPQAQVLDLSELSFVVLRQLPGAGYAPVNDWYFATFVSFTLDISGTNPWDQYSVVLPLGRFPGWYTTNQNVMASWSDAPVHLLVGSNKSVNIFYTIPNPVGATPFLANDLVVGRLRGRWLSDSFYKRLAGRQV